MVLDKVVALVVPNARQNDKVVGLGSDVRIRSATDNDGVWICPGWNREQCQSVRWAMAVLLIAVVE